MTTKLFRNLVFWYLGLVLLAWGVVALLFSSGYYFGFCAKELLLGTVAISFAAAVGLFFIFLLIGIGMFVYHDARERGMEGWMWALIAVFVPYFLGLIVYLVVRQPKPTRCPGCGAPQIAGSFFCGTCGKPLQIVCTGCQRPFKAGQAFCPNCGKQLT